MVYYFTSPTDPTVTMYMGKDKHENEFLIKYAQQHDIWFHVDGLSSAHVYLRTEKPITTYEEVDPTLVMECCSLTKANSIEGCKKNSVGMNWTWASNLLKKEDMQTGSVSYKNGKLVNKCVIEKNKDSVKALMKTKTERFPDFLKEYNEYLLVVQKEQNASILKSKMAQEEEEK